MIQERVATDTDNNRVFGLVAGRPGIGKTTCITHFPKDQVLGVNIENGMLSLKGSGYSYLDVDNYADLIDLLSTAPKYMKNRTVLFIDSLAEIYDMIKREMRGKYSAAQNFAKSDDIKDQLLYAVRLAKQLDQYTVYASCHTKQVKDGLVVKEELSFDGKLPEDLRKQFDTVIHMTEMEDDHGKSHRVFITSPDHSPMAKARISPWLNVKVNPIEEPNLYKLTQKLLGKQE